MLDKKTLSERDICTKYITPAIEQAGWDRHTQYLEEVSFTDGKIYVKGKLTARGKSKRADYILFYKPNIPIAIVEAKDNKHSVRSGMQQALDYAKILDIPCVFSSNGDGFLFHNRTITDERIEQELTLDEFPTPDQLWEVYKQYKGITTEEQERIALQDYYLDGSGRKPRYYQQIAVNRTVEAIARGQSRILLVMATGTGKTYTAFQIVYRLWKAGVKKRILFLADRNALIDQTRRGDFKHLQDVMTVVQNHTVDKSYEVYLALYQGLTGSVEAQNIYRQFSPDFFDLIVVDECHRGSASADSAWRDILTYFTNAAQLGLTATPRETTETSNSEYFGDPIYTYSLRQGIQDGFLAPYRVVRVGLNVDLEGWRPERNKTDKEGMPVEDRIYNTRDFDRKLVIDERTDVVARKLSEFLRGYDRFAKTIVFCQDINHAERMRSAIVRHNADLASQNAKYVMQITGDNPEGKRELDNFINPEEAYPVITTTSELMTTGIDAQTCKVIVLDSNINSMTKFKQIIGRGTRINEEYGKLFFTILDFRNVTNLFADPDFDGDPIRVKPLDEETDLSQLIENEQNDDQPLVDEETEEDIVIEPPQIRYPTPATTTLAHEPREKIFVNGVDVSILVTRELHFDRDGKMITTSLQDYTRELVTGQYATLDDFLNRWNSTEQKQAIIHELEEQGVLVDELRSAVDHEVDLFDLICHVAYDQPPLTRRQRANNVKKRDYFTKYGEQARRVLEALLQKYADEGVENLESMEVLKVKPLADYGTPIELIKHFGGKEDYLAALRELEVQLYQTGA
jgi:type I restriction enzyme R subunit